MAKSKRKSKGRGSSKKSFLQGNKELSYKMALAHSVPSVLRSLRPKIYDFVRVVEKDSLLESSHIAWTGGAMNFQLGQVAEYSDFTRLFDSYQIAKVKVDFIPDITSVNVPIDAISGNTLTTPTVYVSRDLDDSSVPADADDLEQRQDLYKFRATKRFTISLVPQVGREIYRTLATTAYETPYKVIWMDAGYSNVPHFGLKYGITPTGATSPLSAPKFTYKIRTTYWMRFRRVR